MKRRPLAKARRRKGRRLTAEYCRSKNGQEFHGGMSHWQIHKMRCTLLA